MDECQLEACPGIAPGIACALVRLAFEVTGSSLRFRTALTRLGRLPLRSSAIPESAPGVLRSDGAICGIWFVAALDFDLIIFGDAVRKLASRNPKDRLATTISPRGGISASAAATCVSSQEST
jgi:hypothetical protein